MIKAVTKDGIIEVDAGGSGEELITELGAIMKSLRKNFIEHGHKEEVIDNLFIACLKNSKTNNGEIEEEDIKDDFLRKMFGL